jgi:eukaryotic-like serine/threonine-protein kinase
MAAPSDEPDRQHMTAEEWQEIKAQLHQILMLEPELRAGQLEGLAQRYPTLRGELEGLAASYGEIKQDFLEPASAWWSSHVEHEPTPPSLIGARMGPYEIIGQIGAGGMGEVFRARRADRAFEKEVAIKLVRAGHDSTFILSRFKQERQILAGLDHVNIARLVDGGTSEQGLPYFVMELIDGSRITDYCEEHARSIEEGLKLFVQVCQAVEYAHRHGIIHRDIKPGNIVVTTEGIPKLLDFGIAKLLDPGSNASYSTSTMSMFRPLTPAYASPEQISGGPITKSTDIYSLGVVLYELLCGQGPYATTDGSPDDLARAVRETNPPPPSEARSVEAPAEEGKQTEPQRARRERLKRLRGDLDTIVMTALRKEPERRYASAEAFAQDIEHHLAGRPICAHKDSLVYRAAKFGRRNSRLVLAVSLLVLAIASSIAAFIWQTRYARPIVPAANSVRVRPSAAVLGFRNVSAKGEYPWVSRALSDVLNRTLAAGGQFRNVNQELVAKSKVDLSIPDAEVLDRAQLSRMHRALDSDYIVLGSYSVGNGEIRLDIRAQDTRTGETIASVSDNGLSPALVELALRTGASLRQRLGIGDLTSAELKSLTAAFPAAPEAMGDYSEGQERLNLLDAEGAKEALVTATERAPEHALSHYALSVAWSMLGYESRAMNEAKRATELSGELSRPDQLSIEARYRETIHQKARSVEIYKTLFQLFPDDIEYGLRLAELQTDSGKGGDARETLKALRKLPDPMGRDPRIDLAEANAASSLGDYQLSMKAAARAVQQAEADGTRSIAAQAHFRQGVAFLHTQDFDRAKQSLRSAIALYDALGNRRGVASGWNGLGNVLNREGDLAGSRHAYERALEELRQVGDKSEMAGVIGNLSNVVGDAGDLDLSLKLYEQELSIAREIDDRHLIAETLNNIGVIEVLQGRLTHGANHFQESIEILRDLGDIDYVAQALDSLGSAQLLRGDVTEAINSFNEELANFQKAGEEQAVAFALGNLGQALAMSGDLKGAEENLNHALAMTRKSGEKHYIAENLTALGRVHYYEAREQESRKEYEEAISIHDKMGEAYTQEETRLGLAALDLEQGRYDEAASLTRQALNEAEKERMRDEQLMAHAMLARILAKQHQPGLARSQLAVAERIAGSSENLAARFTFTIAKAEVTQPTLSARLRRELQAVVTEAHERSLIPAEYAANFQLGLDEASSSTSHNCSRLNALRNETSARGFRRIAEAGSSICH